VALRNRYRIFIVPSGAPEVKQVELSIPRLAIAIFLSMLLVVGIALTTWVAFQASKKESIYKVEIERLHEENQAQQFHIQRFAERTEHLNQQMERLENFYTKLKILTNIDLQEHSDAPMATGGPNSAEPELNAYLENNLKRQIQRIHWELEELQLQALLQEKNVHRVENFFDSQRSLLAATPSIWPVRGWVTSNFGNRVSPFTGSLQMHDGFDIGARSGTPVKAAANGVVIYSGWKSEYGKTVTLDQRYG